MKRRIWADHFREKKKGTVAVSYYFYRRTKKRNANVVEWSDPAKQDLKLIHDYIAVHPSLANTPNC